MILYRELDLIIKGEIHCRISLSQLAKSLKEKTSNKILEIVTMWLAHCLNATCLRKNKILARKFSMKRQEITLNYEILK